MRLDNWDYSDDESVQAARYKSRYERALEFLDDALDEPEEDPTLAEEAPNLPEPEAVEGGGDETQLHLFEMPS